MSPQQRADLALTLSRSDVVTTDGGDDLFRCAPNDVEVDVTDAALDKAEYLLVRSASLPRLRVIANARIDLVCHVEYGLASAPTTAAARAEDKHSVVAVAVGAALTGVLGSFALLHALFPFVPDRQRHGFPHEVGSCPHGGSYEVGSCPHGGSYEVGSFSGK